MTREEYELWKKEDLAEQKTHSKEIADQVWNEAEQKLKKKFIEGTFTCKSRNISFTVHQETNTLMWKRLDFILYIPEINLEMPCVYYGNGIAFDIDKYGELLLPYYNEGKEVYYKKIIEESRKECTNEEWIKIPYDKHTSSLKWRQQEVIDCYYKMELSHYEEWNEKYIPIYGYCYYDHTGIYLAKYTATDYYKQTHKIVMGTYRDAQMKGDYAEFWIPKRIFDDYSGYCKKLWNTYIPVNEETNDYQEIDVIVLTEYGIIAFECKNRITPVSFPDIEADRWRDAVNNEFYSPLKQNRTHIEALKRYLSDIVPENVPYFNVICLLQDCESIFFHEHQAVADQYELAHKDIVMGCTYTVGKKLNQLFENSEKVVSTDILDKVYEKLYENTQFDSEKKKKIVERIKERHEKK